MFLLIFAFAVVAVVLSGMGLLVRRAFRWAGGEAEPFLSPFWVGWAAALVFLQAWNFVLPIGGWARASLLVLGVGGIVLERHEFLRRARSLRSRPELIVLALGAALLVARMSLGPVGNGDSGIYHIPVATWAKSAPLVIGLANLSPMLGLDSSYFLFVAALDAGPFTERAQHLAPGVLVLGLLVQCFGGLLHQARRAGAPSAPTLLAAFLLPVAIDQLTSHDLVSASADLAVASAAVALAVATGELLARRRDAQPCGSLALETIVLASAGMTLKLSFFVGASLTLVLAFFALAKERAASRRSLAVLGAALLLGPVGYVVRGALLTGYVGYPSALIPLPVFWRLPIEDAAAIYDYVLAWGRSSGGPPKPCFGTWAWFGPWLESALLLNRQFTIPMFCAAVGGVAWLGAKLKRRAGPGALAWLTAIPVASIAYWMLTAPDPRFANASLWLLPASLGLCALVAWKPSSAALRTLLGMAAILAVWPLGSVRLPPVSSLGELEPLPTVVTTSFKTASGVELSVPASESAMCYAAPPPCTFFHPVGLRARALAGHLAYETVPGQRALDGPWIPRYERAGKR